MTKTMYYLETAITNYHKMIINDSIDNEINNRPSMTSRQCVKTEYEILSDILKQYGIATIIRAYLDTNRNDTLKGMIDSIDDTEINCSSMDCLKNVFQKLIDLQYFLQAGLSQRAIANNHLI